MKPYRKRLIVKIHKFWNNIIIAQNNRIWATFHASVFSIHCLLQLYCGSKVSIILPELHFCSQEPAFIDQIKTMLGLINHTFVCVKMLVYKKSKNILDIIRVCTTNKCSGSVIHLATLFKWKSADVRIEV